MSDYRFFGVEIYDIPGGGFEVYRVVKRIGDPYGFVTFLECVCSTSEEADVVGDKILKEEYTPEQWAEYQKAND